MKTTATKLRSSLSFYLESSEHEDIIIEKHGKAKAVLISYERFEFLSLLEDKYWGERALEAEKGGYLSLEESNLIDFLIENPIEAKDFEPLSREECHKRN